MDRIPKETGAIAILFILSILSKTLNVTFRPTVHFPWKLTAFLPSFSWYGMAVDGEDERLGWRVRLHFVHDPVLSAQVALNCCAI